MKKQKPDADAEATKLDKLLAVLVLLAVPVDSRMSTTIKMQAILKKRKED